MKKALFVAVIAALAVSGCKLDFRNMPAGGSGGSSSSISHAL